MQVFEYLLTDIKPYENNPRRNDDAVEAVANSIREFGWQQPIVIDTDGVIIAGHTRYKAALQLGLEKAPVVIADGLSEEQIRAYRLADNKTAELANWDFGLLSDELDDITDIDMEQFGFDNIDLEGIDGFFSSEPVAQKEKKTKYIKATCPECGFQFDCEAT